MQPFDPPGVEDLIPHRDKMKLLDRIIAVSQDGQILTALAVVRPDWPLTDQKSVSTVLGIELIAQAIGCLRGYGQLGRQDLPPAGFLVGVKKSRFLQPEIPMGSDLEITVRQIYGMDSYGGYEGVVSLNGARVCEAVLQVMSPQGEALLGLLEDGSLNDN